ncbi:MAG: hypothetical protein GYA73_09870, partial [Planctomycetes bacterium]|nr:hypothetical protein [Planctomycetota bacterium]
FADKIGGRNYLHPDRHAFVTIARGGAISRPVACAPTPDGLVVTFAEPAAAVTLRAAAKGEYLVFEIADVSGPAADEIVFAEVRLALSGRASEMSGVIASDAFAAAARPLNLKTTLELRGGFRPRASASRGIVGARIALAAAPPERLRAILKDVVRQEDLPWSPLGGPFALDAEENRGSYVFATVSEQDIDAWIALARKAGLMQIHLIAWEQSLGSYAPRKDLFPQGLEGLKAVVAKIHAAGLKAGMHTLTGGIARNDPFVTPVPDPRLAKDGKFTLAADIGDADDVVPLTEPPGNLETSWEYSGRSNIVQIGTELIEYRGLSRNAPYALTACVRGALGTRRAAHARGAAVHHLLAIYGTFQPDENSTLVAEVAECIARPFNECGFDMIYQDGAEGMPGGPYGWAVMREAVFRRLQGRVLVEASQWGCLSWPYHSRIGAYDHPNWGLKRFTDVHLRDVESYRASSLLAAQLGWWAILGPSPDHPAEFPDEIEYLCAKALATDMPMSFQGLGVGPNPWNARQDEYLELIGRYERLRLARAVPEAARQRLGAPREDFRLLPRPGGGFHFVPADYLAHKVTGLDDGSTDWTVRNRHAAQPLKARVEALFSAEPYESAGAAVLAGHEKPEEIKVEGAARGVTAAWALSKDGPKTPAACGRYTAKSALPARRGAWALARAAYSPPVDIGRCGALGVWIRGDGKGELLNFQLTNPPRFWPTLAEHYVDVDFEGWRYVELHLRERDADRFGDYLWPYGGTYEVFRSPLVRAHTSALGLYYNNLPPNETVECTLSAVKALPVVKVALDRPALTVGGRAIVFPVALESGQYIEMESMEDCRLYDERGALLKNLAPEGEAIELAPGENSVRFACVPPAGHRARAKVTLILCGEPFGACDLAPGAGGGEDDAGRRRGSSTSAESR